MRNDEGEAVKGGESVDVEETAHVGQSDRSRKGRSSAATVRLARTGAILANGADSISSAMEAAGYSPWTARNPTENGVTVARALAAAAEAFPSVRKTLKGLRPKAIGVLDRGMDLEKGELPGPSHLQAAAVSLKMASELGDDEPEGVTNAERHNAHAQMRRCARRFGRVALQRAAQIGVSAALAELQTFEVAERERFPRLREIDASSASRPLEEKRWRT
jgi:hypothetical protein